MKESGAARPAGITPGVVVPGRPAETLPCFPVVVLSGSRPVPGVYQLYIRYLVLGMLREASSDAPGELLRQSLDDLS